MILNNKIIIYNIEPVNIINSRFIIKIVLLHSIHINNSENIGFLGTFTKFVKPLQIIIDRNVWQILCTKTRNYCIVILFY